MESQAISGVSEQQHASPCRDDTFQQQVETALAAEPPSAAQCLDLARTFEERGDRSEAARWAGRVVDAGDDFTSWQAASAAIRRLADSLPKRRTARVALLGSHTTIQLAQLLPLAASRLGITADVYEGAYGQYQQEILDPGSGMYAFDPDFVILAVDEREMQLPEFTDTHQQAVESELNRWTTLWQTVSRHSKARVVQCNFATSAEQPLGHLGARVPGSRYAMTYALNARLGEAAGNDVFVVDCEHLSGLFGKIRWHDPRYWFHAKQAVALGALPLLARHMMAVVAGDLGLSRKCIVVDLDNTLWGGVIGEDGLSGLRLGESVDGEAFVVFQEYLLRLKEKGILLAVCSKNNESDAREPFQRLPDMRIRLSDIAVFVANWEPKSQNLRRIAETLNIGLDALVFVDDNPVERNEVRRLLPEVEVIPLPPDPTQYVRTVASCLQLETAAMTAEDANRTEQYQVRTRTLELERASDSISDFQRSLEMQAMFAPFDELHLPRIAQLVGKTNQFNLTTRRHGLARLREFMTDPNCVHRFLRLRDRFTDHGLVGVVIARKETEVLDIDTWLMSCRVIGRTVETAMFADLCRAAELAGCHCIRGTYVPTVKNAPVEDVFRKHGFELTATNERAVTWLYDLRANGSVSNLFVRILDPSEFADDVAYQT